MDCKDYCQCCGMPMGGTNELYGLNADGTKSQDYCKYCYDKGVFTSNISMDEMIESCVVHVVSANPEMTADAAKNMMKEFFPTLKRWKNQD